ncbi:MAG: carboxypeptidase regulatory-like domain-containing protein, partial [Crocinitomicaceae bacterium]
MGKFLLFLATFSFSLTSFTIVLPKDTSNNNAKNVKVDSEANAVMQDQASPSTLVLSQKPTVSKRDVRGTLIDAVTKNPTEKVTVILQHKESGKRLEAESDDDGIFLFKGVPVGEYQLLIEDKEYLLRGDPETAKNKRCFPVA